MNAAGFELLIPCDLRRCPPNHPVLAFETATPGLVVHQTAHPELAGDTASHWLVVHAPSGMCVARGLSFEHAQFIAAHLSLADRVDWTQSERAIREHPHRSDIAFILDQMGAWP